MQYKDILIIAKNINKELTELGMAQTSQRPTTVPYDIAVTNKSLRKKTEKLFKDGHHARAVEEAYKLLDNLVKKKAGLQDSDLTGAKLMQTVFSPNKPMLKLNEGVSSSEQNEQSGYMQILSGCMTGIRNPRAHESDWEDTESRALQLLTFANHLIERVLMAEKSE
ncbi:MAG: TIGR02391 family protein [Lachnospiraceae bacterium]